MGSNHIIISIRFFSSTVFITQVIHLADEYTDTDKYFKMAFRSCLCLICHTTSSSPLIFQELKLLLPAQRHKECQGHGADRKGKARNGKRRVGNSSVCITCWRKGAVREETKKRNRSEGGGSGFSQLGEWEGENASRQRPRSGAGQGTQRCLKCQDLRVTSYVTGKINSPDWQQNHCFSPELLNLNPMMIPYTSERGEARQVETNSHNAFILFCVKNSYSIINFWWYLQSAELIHFLSFT